MHRETNTFNFILKAFLIVGYKGIYLRHRHRWGIILKFILINQDGRVWTVLIWLRIGESDELLWIPQLIFVFLHVGVVVGYLGTLRLWQGCGAWSYLFYRHADAHTHSHTRPNNCDPVLRNRETAGSILSPEMGYHEWHFSWYYSVTAEKHQDILSNYLLITL